jgi:hypothetical protein
VTEGGEAGGGRQTPHARTDDDHPSHGGQAY